MWKNPRSIQFVFATVLGAIFCLLISQNANAAAYIKFDGIDGEVVDTTHKDWVELLSFNHSIVKERADATSGRRKTAQLSDIAVVKELDKSTPKLAETLLTGQVIPEVTIELTRRNGNGEQTTYLKYELKNVLITSYQFQGSGENGAVPIEEISLNFEEIKVTYTFQDPTGSSQGNVEYSWKVEEGES